MFKRVFKFSKRPLVWDTIKTTFWSTIGRGAGFLIPFFIAAWFGVSEETDAFFFAYGIILFLSGIFAPVVESVIVPYVAEARTNNEDVGKFIGNILSVGSVGLLALTALLLLIINPILSLITKFDDKTLRLVYLLLVETSPLIIFLVWTSVLSGTLNTYKKFTFPAISPAIRAAVNLFFIFVFKDRCGVHSIAFGYLAGEIVRLFFLWIVVKQLNLFKLCLSFRLNKKLIEFLKTASYQSTGMVAVGLNPIVNQTMASWLGKGSVSILSYADRLHMIPRVFLSTGLLITLLSHWSERYQESGFNGLNRDLNKSLKVVGIAGSAFAVLLIVFHQPLVRLAFGRGRFAQERLSEIGWVWVCYLLGFSTYIMTQIYARAFFTLKKTDVLLRCGFYMFFLNITFSLILMRYFKIYGIATSTTLVSVMTFFYLKQVFNNISKENNGNSL